MDSFKRHKIFIPLLILLYLFSTTLLSAQKDIFLRKFPFSLAKISDNDYENEYFMTIQMNKGTKYLFKITNNIEANNALGVVEVLEGDKMLVTNLIEDKYYDQFLFQCNKTGFYDILIKMKDNEKGYIEVDLFMEQ